MKSFDDASAVEQVCYEFKLSDYVRALNRVKINDLFNGVPPYTADEVERNDIPINVNFLGATRLGHDARMQFNGNFLKPGKFFTCTTDMGPRHKRVARSAIVTKEIAKIMKASHVYYETFRSKFALDVLHGIGPSAWDKPDFWCPDAKGVEDVLVPAKTLLTMKNLPFFALYSSYTGPELARLTRDRKASSAAGWDMKLVDRCLKYIDEVSTHLMGNSWPEVWSPEKTGERIKGDGGFYASDQVPTIDCFDFYFWDDDNKEEGWKRRIILDAWSTPQGIPATMSWNSEREWARGQFLFTSKNRKVAAKWSQIVSFQFADLSAVAPFHIHTIRSMGWLLYAVVNLQNRMRCKFNESVFETLMMYLRVKNTDEVERALKVELFNRGFIDESVQFIPATERWQPNHNLVQNALADNERIINEHTSSFVQSTSQFRDRTEKTKFQVMAEIQSMTAMISAGMQQAYRYQEFEYREIFRRFCLPNSRDPDVNRFRARCFSQGVPEAMLNPDAWDIDPERVLGAGNKTLEMAIAEQLMQFRNLYDPEPQRQILRDFTMAITDDPARADMMVPDEPNRITDSVHDAQLAAGTLMQGLPVAIKTGMNHIEYVNTLLISMQLEIGKINSKGGVPTMEKLEGLDSINQHIQQHIAIVSQDPNERDRVNNWNNQLSKLMNVVRAFAQRLQEQQQKAAEAGGANGEDAQTAAKVKAAMLQAQVKAENTKTAHAQRTAQRSVQFEMEQQRENQKMQAELERENQRLAVELGAREAEAAQKVEAERQKAEAKAEAAPKED